MKIKLTNFRFFYRRRFHLMIMRIIIFLLCTTVFSLAPKNSFSQEKVIIDQDQSVTVDEVFNIIQQQTDYHFIFPKKLFENSPNILLKKGEVLIVKLLEKSLQNSNLEFEVNDNNTIFIKKNSSTNQNTSTIKGTVLDNSGLPLPGIAVLVSSKPPNGNNITFKSSTTTNFDGEYQIAVDVNDYLIIKDFRFITAFKQVVSGKSQYDFTLSENLNMLDELVLTGYTKTEKDISAVASSKIDKKNLQRQKVINLEDKLEGLSLGLNINTTTPSQGRAGVEVILRGVSTFDIAPSSLNSQAVRQVGLNRQPLIVVDGFPYEGPLNDIDAQTIETIDVLRDAAATTIWGVRAANGVIVITTKRGKTGKARISVTSNVTLGTNQDLNDLGLASAEETIKIYNEAYEIQPSFSPGFSVINGFGPFNRYRRLNSLNQIWAQFYDGMISETERDNRFNELGQNNVLDDIQKYLIRPTIITENSLNMLGGSEAAKYSFTASYVDEKRVDVGDSFNRLNLNLNTDLKVSDRLNVVLDIALASSKTEDNGVSYSALFGGNPDELINIYDRLADDNGNPLPVYDVYSGYRDEFLSLGFDDPSYSPLLDQKLRDNKLHSLNLRLAAGLNYKILNGLNLDVKYQYNSIMDELENNKTLQLYETRINNNNYISNVIDADNAFVTRSVPYGGTLEREVTNSVNKILRGSLNFERDFNAMHKLSVIAGMEISENSFALNRQTFFGYDDETGLYDRFFAPPEPGFVGSTFGNVDSYLQNGSVRANNNFIPELISRSISSFSSLNYSYKGKYSLNASGKIDQATAFGINKRLSKPLFWAVGGAWNIHKESFLQNTNWLDQLKLRVSYGKNGNLRRGLTTVTTIGISNNDFVNTGPVASIASPANPNLSFETTITKNIGLDFGLFNRLSGTIDLYDKQSEDLLTRNLVNDTYGLSNFQVYTNNGSISNKGIEIALNADLFKTDNFTWNSSLNFSYNKNEVLSYNFNPANNANAVIANVNANASQIIGEPISAIYRYKWAGLNADGLPQIFNDDGAVVDSSSPSDQLPTELGLEVTKPFVAPIFGGFQNVITYKQFTLSSLITYKFGHIFQEVLAYKNPRNTSANVFHKDVENRWQNPGDEEITNIPSYTENFSFVDSDLFTNSNLFIHDASYVRLRDVTLGYSLNDNAVEKIGFQSVNLSFQVRNLGLIWKANDVDIDPESVPFSGSGFSSSSRFPQAYRPGIKIPVSFVFGLTANF